MLLRLFFSWERKISFYRVCFICLKESKALRLLCPYAYSKLWTKIKHFSGETTQKHLLSTSHFMIGNINFHAKQMPACNNKLYFVNKSKINTEKNFKTNNLMGYRKFDVTCCFPATINANLLWKIKQINKNHRFFRKRAHVPPR